MAKPLTSADTNPENLQFKHFGILDAGAQSKASLATSITANVMIALILLIIGTAAKKTMDKHLKELSYVVPLKEKPPEPIRPKIIPPKIVPPKVVIKPVEPKIVLPDVKIPEPPKVLPVMQPKPVPIVVPAPPKLVVAAAAPKPVAVSLAQSASVVNHDAHPSAVALGHPDSLIHPSNAPGVAAVNLSQRGLGGMPSSNTGGGPPSAKVSLGSGQPDGSIGGTGARAVQGVKLGGVTNGTGTTPGNGLGMQARQVSLGGAPPPPGPVAATVRQPARTAPQVLFKPKPTYTAEATAKHIEGTVSVKIKVSAAGAVTVVGVSNGLGYGLDEAALRAAQGIRFKPAVDASGNPIDWEGVVNINFQIAS